MAGNKSTLPAGSHLRYCRSRVCAGSGRFVTFDKSEVYCPQCTMRLTEALINYQNAVADAAPAIDPDTIPF